MAFVRPFKDLRTQEDARRGMYMEIINILIYLFYISLSSVNTLVGFFKTKTQYYFHGLKSLKTCLCPREGVTREMV